ncbi:hypothetical protein PCANB_000930 [Pneumocystis canis]|nr:hypothetical protein PCANB_000930 [Pneumocystis canis]
MVNKDVLFEEKISRIQDQSASKTDHQKQIATVLFAIKDTLHNEKVECNITTYFGSLLVLLEKSLSNINNKNILYPILYLLDLVIPYTNTALLCEKYDQISSLLSTVLTLSEIDTLILQHTISCLENFLIIQENPTWTNPNNNIKSLFSCLLILSLDIKSKCRKRAQEAVGKILSHPPPSPSIIHPILEFSSKQVLNIAKKNILESKEAIKYKNGITFDHSKTIYTFQLIKVIIETSGWPSSKIEQLCNVLMDALESKDNHLAIKAFNVFQIIFEKWNSIPEKLYDILESILKKKPSEKDTMLLIPWFLVLTAGFKSCSKIKQHPIFMHFPQIFMDLFPFLQSNSFEIRTACNEVLITLISNYIPNCIKNDEIIIKLNETIMQGFTLAYRVAWKEIFKILIVFFEYLPSYIDPYFIDALKLINEMRERNNFNGKLEADQVIGAAIKTIGPKAVLKILPLKFNLENKELPTETWMLPVLRSNIYNTELEHFITAFIPFSEQLYQKILESENLIQKKTYEVYIEQIWSLFPSYCNYPTDLQTAFNENFVQLLITVLYNQANLRPIICQALKILINKNKKIVDDNHNYTELKLKFYTTKLDAEKNLVHLEKFASNILSALFNIYSQTLSQFREYILVCIKSWLSITNEKDIVNIFNRIIELLLQSLEKKTNMNSDKEDTTLISHIMLDLLIAITIYLPSNTNIQLYDIVKSQILNETDHILQKKAYNLFCKMAENPFLRSFLKNNIKELQEIFLENASKTNTSIRKDANKKTRTIANNLLILIGNRMLESNIIEDDKTSRMNNDILDVKAHIQEFFTVILAGLAGDSPYMISATIISITKLLYMFKDSLSLDFIDKLLSTVYMYTASSNHEIAKSALGFVKMTVVCLPISIIEKWLSMLIPNLMIWLHEDKGHFKMKVKNIIEKMTRRYGFNVVEKEIPSEDKKLIINIRKTKERLKRKKNAKRNKLKINELNSRNNILNRDYEAYKNEDSDSSISINTSDFKSKEISEKQQKLIKKADNELIDLLDKNSLTQIIATNSKNSKKYIKKQPTISDFKIDNSGKIIIQDYDKEFNTKNLLKSSNQSFNEYSDFIKSKDDFFQQSNKKYLNNKRKKNESDNDSTDTYSITEDKRNLNNQKIKKTQNFKHAINKQKIIKFK